MKHLSSQDAAPAVYGGGSGTAARFRFLRFDHRGVAASSWSWLAGRDESLSGSLGGHRAKATPGAETDADRRAKGRGALRLARHLYAMVEAAPCGMIAVNEQGQIAIVNAESLRMFVLCVVVDQSRGSGCRVSQLGP